MLNIRRVNAHFIIKVFFALALVFSLSNLLIIKGEGTKQIQPKSTDYGYVVLDPAWSNFALYGCLPEERLQISICNLGEKIYYGFNQGNNDVRYRIKDPNGNIVVGQTNVPSSGTGFISAYSRAVAGPTVLPGNAASGYPALSYTPTMTGDYYIEFLLPSGSPRRTFRYFDITVTTAANTAIPGRVWSKSWMLSTDGYGRPFNGKMYVYADDSVVTSLDFNGMDPYVFVLNANGTGTQSTGNFVEDRKSQLGKSTYPKYKVFLNDPDETCYPTGELGKVIRTDVSGCPGSNFCANVVINRTGNVQVLLDLDGNPGYQAGTKDVLLQQVMYPPGGCVNWDGKDGLGNKVTYGVTVQIGVNFYNGLTNIPLYDVEANTKGYKVALVRPTGAPIKMYWDDSNIPGGTVNTTSGCNPCHTWNWTCCNNSPSDYGNGNTVNTYWYAGSSTAGKSYTIPPPVVVDADNRPNAGGTSKNDTTVCKSFSTYTLSGQVTNGTGSGTWTTTGTGTFSNATSLTGTYNISAADKAAGLVKLILTAPNNSGCLPVSDTLYLRFQDVPTASAGPAATVCANNPAVSLSGSYTGAGGAVWSSAGTGTFSPSANSLTATYTPSAAEVGAGTATLTLSTTGNNKCAAATGNKVITIQASPTVTPGPAQTVCANNPNLTLAGAVTNATSQVWSGGAGTFSPNNTTLNATYTPTASEIGSGTVTLTLTASRAGCNSVSGNTTITIQPAPTVNAGADQSVCFNNAAVTLSGSGSATSYTWSGGVGTFSPNTTTLNAVYTPTLTEKNNGSFTLTLTGTRAGCNPVSDQMTVTVTPAPVSNAGTDGVVCANKPSYTLSGSVTGATGGVWTSSGGGNFFPNPATLNAVYTPTAAEISTRLAALVLTTTGNGSCNPATDTVIITINPAPTANAGADKSVCANNPAVTITGSSTNASNILWTGGAGTFSPGVNFSAINYQPTATEIATGTLTLTLTANRSTCNPVSDDVVITFTQPPTVNAGADQTVCYNNANVTLNGTVMVATGATWSGGAGTFSPNANTINAVYTPTATEKNNGSFTLTLTSTGNGNCNAVSDQMTVTVSPAPAANAGADQTVCGNKADITLNGSVTLATGGTWTGGTGTFTPGPNSLSAGYSPSATEIATGSATLTLTTTGNGNCNPVNDQIVLTITPAPTVNAGTDKSVCAATPTVTLTGSKTVAGGVIWSGGAGTFNPDNTSLNATYTPTASEISTGSVNLTITSTANGNCNPVSDQMTVSIPPAPSVSAGPDQTVCAATGSVSLNGTVTGATGVTWSTSGSGSFSPNASTANASYVPSASDKTSGSVTLTLTSTGNGVCSAVADQMVITFTSVPTINAGPDKIACTNDLPAVLNGSGSPATWSGGSGTFSPNTGTLNASYTPTPAEIITGSVTLTLTTNPSGACPSVSDQVVITLPPAPVANAGPDQTMCGNNATYTLSGSVINATGGFWTTSGTGSFSNPNALNAIYTPSALDKSNGSVTLTLSTTGNGSCTSHSDAMTLTIQPSVAVTAGPDQTVCGDKTGFNLSGASVSNVTGGTWTTSGSGSFSPDNTTINATYVPSAADKSAGTVTLTLTTAANGACPAMSDDVVYTITTPPTINAGPDQTICADIAGANLNGSVTGASGAVWTSSGTGTFSPDAATLNAVYYASPADKGSGSVTLKLTSTGSGTCNAVSDPMVLTIAKTPVVNAGADQTVCGDVGSVNLSGTVTVASGGAWTSTGDGTFANPNAPATSYTPGPNDIVSGTVTLTLTSTGNGVCTAKTDQMVLTITPVPTVNAGSDRSICKNNPDIALSGAVTVATGGTWSGGAGTFAPSSTSLNAVYTPAASELAAGSLTLTLTTTGNGLCQAKADQVVITFTNAPVTDAGTDQTICADSASVALNASFTISSGGTWTTTGTGNFVPNSATANASYVPSMADRSSGLVTLRFTTTGNGNCKAVADSMRITITPAPTVNAGSDQTVCANNANITLSGSKTVASGGTWTSSGTGTFANAGSTATTYTPSSQDKTAGSVVLTLTTTGNGSCKAVYDQMTVTITPAPSVNAGPDQTVCANKPDITLSGSVTVATGATWSTSGSGIFTPNATSLNAQYTPSPSDIGAGTVTLTLTTTGNGLCNAVTDQMIVTITPAPTINAGPDQTLCADVPGITLSGTATVASGGIWTSSGSGIFTPNASSLNVVYKPSAADTAVRKISLALTSTGNGNCIAVSDTMVITLQPAPVVNAGPDQTICGNTEFVNLAGTIANAGGGTWTTSGSGFFTPDATTLTGQYLPGGAESNGGSVTLTLTTTGNGLCAARTDQMVLSISPVPVANAGPDQTVCANNAGALSLNGSVTNSTGGIWTSNGDGTFANSNTLSTTYTPSATDIAAGTIVLNLETISGAGCNAVSDQMVITFTPAPTADAGADQSVCANNASVTMNGAVTVASGGTWTSSGTGSFSPSATALNGKYTPSAADIASGTVTLTLTTTGNGNCNAVSDAMVVTITPAPSVNPGAPVTVCANTAGIPLTGIVTVATGGTWSTASGTGTFSPDANTLNATFIPSAQQIANGRANLTLSTTGNGNCAAVSATVSITLQSPPSANAGPDVQVCTGTSSIAVNGSVTGATGGTWTTSGGGTFLPDANTLNATYNPSAAENADGSVVTLTLTTTGNGACAPMSDQMAVTFQTVPVDAGPDQTVCSNALPVQLNGSGNGTWSGGAGTFSDPTSLNTAYIPDPSEIPGTVTITLTGVAVGACIPGTDDVVITLLEGPKADAGTDQSVCSNNATVTLGGTVTNATGGTWTSEGSGTFANDTDLNTTYTASAADIASGSIKLTLTTTGNGVCNPNADTLTITFTPAPVADAGSDQTACANSGPVSLNGTVSGASGFSWSIVSGNGIIGDPSALVTTYTPDPSDVSAGSVTLRLTATEAGCNPVVSDMVITIGSAPTADPGPNQTVCGDIGTVTLNGNVTVAAGGQWSTSGSGTFSPNANTLNVSYIPSSADTSAGNVTLTLTTAGNGTCSPVSGSMTLAFTDVPTVNAGTDQTICADLTTTTVSGTVSVATGGIWSSSGTGTFGNNTSLSTSYTPSASDKAAGSVVLTLVTTGNGSCKTYNDQVTLLITPAPSIEAGQNQAGCVDVAAFDLSGTVTAATGGTWTSTGSGTFGDPNSLITTYAPSAADRTSGAVTLTLTSTGNGTCNAVSDPLTISFTPAPTLTAGNDRNICADKDSVHIEAAFTVATGIAWTSSGSGTFAPDASSPAAAYYFSASDLASGSVTLTAVTTGNGTCNQVSDQIIINIAPKPVVNAGADQIACAGQGDVTLNGSVVNALGGTWSTNGTGTFAGGSSLATTYTPSAADLSNGGITITLTSTGNGTCNAQADLLVVTFIPSPAATVNAGQDQTLCADVASIKLTGFVYNAGGGTWSTAGTGAFSPDAVTLETNYLPTATEKSSGSVVLTLTTTDNGQCNAVSDDVTIFFTPAPTANAGIDQVVCGDASAVVNLSGAVTVATGGSWTTGGNGIFAPDPATLSTTYYPSAEDKTAGKVGLTLTTTGNGTCNPVTDVMFVTLTKPPTANAGTDKTICADVVTFPLNGKVTVATGGAWTTSGSGTFINPNGLNTGYSPSSADTAARVINLTLTTTGNGTCLPVNDQVKINFTPVPIVNAGPDITACSNTNAIRLSGKVWNATGGTWTTSGSGIFSNPNTLNTFYSPSAGDVAAGSVTISLNSFGTGICSQVSDQVVITFQPVPTVDPGAASICEVADGSALNGMVINATGGKWSTSGTGVFAPDATALNATYYPSAADVATKTITLTLTSTGNGACAAVSASTKLNITPMPVANAGQDQYICPGSSTTLSATTSPQVTYSWSDKSGTVIGTTPVINITANNDTTLVLTVTDTKGCYSRDSVNVRVFTMPVLTLAADNCMSENLLLNSNPSPQPSVPGVYQWYKNGFIMTGNNAPVLSPADTGTYKIVFSYGNCFSTASTVVHAPPVLRGDFVKDCEGASTAVTVASAPTGVNYTWSTGQTGMDLSTINVTVVPDTTYYVATVTDMVGCSSKDSVRVIGIPLPVFNLADLNSCEGRTETLNARPSNIVNLDSLYPSYQWYKNNSVLPQTTDSLTVNTTGDYKVVLTIGRCVNKDSATVIFYPNPLVDLPERLTFCQVTDGYLLLDAGSGAGYSYQWIAPPGITLDSSSTRTTAVKKEGRYSVLITNSFNCSSKDSVFADEVCKPRVYVPNAFIPESTGEDQKFRVFGDDFANFTLTVFNRWGEVIFMSSDKNEAWDGRYRGELMPPGVYPWVVTYEGKDAEFKGPYVQKGSVTIIR